MEEKIAAGGANPIVDMAAESGDRQEAGRRRSQYLAAPSWRGIPPPKLRGRKTQTHQEPRQAPYRPREAAQQKRSNPLVAYLSEFDRLQQPPKRPRAEKAAAAEEAGAAASDSGSDSSSSDSEEEEEQQQRAPVLALPCLSPGVTPPPQWPDPAMTDFLIQQACCPVDPGLDPAIAALEGSLGSLRPFSAPPRDPSAAPGRRFAEACSSATANPSLNPSTSADGAAAAAAAAAAALPSGASAPRSPRPLPGAEAAALPWPQVQVGYRDEWLEALPSAALPLWEKAPLQPYSEPKSVAYYAVCPEEAAPEAERFLRDLGAAYEAAGLGDHGPAPAVGPSGGALRLVRAASALRRRLTGSEALKEAPRDRGTKGREDVEGDDGEEEDEGEEERRRSGEGGAKEGGGDEGFLAGLREACSGLQRSLESAPPRSRLGCRPAGGLAEPWEGRAALVVYLMLPRGASGGSSCLASAALLEAAAHLAPATSAAAAAAAMGPTPSGAPAASWPRRTYDITLQVVDSSGLGDLSGASARATAFSVYQKIRRQPCATDASRSSDNPLPPPTPPVIGYAPTPKAQRQQQQQGQQQHPAEESVTSEDSLVAHEAPPEPPAAPSSAGAPSCGPQASSSLLHEPLFVLARQEEAAGPDGSSSSKGKRQGGPASAAVRGSALHCCYAWGGAEGGPGRRWAAVCWTDCTGELLEARLLPGPPPACPGDAREEADGGAVQKMCNTLLHETFRVAARASAAAGNRAKLQRLVMTRLGPTPEGPEAAAWDAAIARCASAAGDPREAHVEHGAPTGPVPVPPPGLESLTLVSLAAELPMQLACGWEPPGGAYALTQPAKQPPGHGDSHANPHQPGPGHAQVVWLPAAAQLPGEDGHVRVLNLEVVQHVCFRDGLLTHRQQSSHSPAMPATPVNNCDAAPAAAAAAAATANGVLPKELDRGSRIREAAAQAAHDLHRLAALTASFHCLCLARPTSAGGTRLGPLGRSGPQAHLPLHCSVAHRLWVLACGAERWSLERQRDPRR